MTPEKPFSSHQLSLSPSFVHQENEFDDFDREVLLPHKMSQHGPALAVADVNGDALDDFYVGGAMGQSGKLYLQVEGNSFISVQDSLWATGSGHEDVSALFFNANEDPFLDIYVVSGGNERT